MATPRERFAAALTALKDLQVRGMVTFYTADLPNMTYREILLKNGFIKEVLKGRYISADPGSDSGDTTAWYSSYWDFASNSWNLSIKTSGAYLPTSH